MMVALLVSSSYADIIRADDADEVRDFLNEYKDKTATLYFHDSEAKKEASENQGGLFGFLGGLFTAEDTDTELERKIAENNDLMKIDIADLDLKEIQELYEVDVVPYIVVIKGGIIVLKEVPNDTTFERIKKTYAENDAAPAVAPPAVTPAPVAEAPVEAAPEATQTVPEVAPEAALEAPAPVQETPEAS